jgi:hypothetical protein
LLFAWSGRGRSLVDAFETRETSARFRRFAPGKVAQTPPASPNLGVSNGEAPAVLRYIVAGQNDDPGSPCPTFATR